MNVIIIAAIGKNRELGKSGGLCWNIPDDLKNFKEITSERIVIMGKKTWESLPIKPLPNRRNIIVTRDKNYNPEGGEVLGDLYETMKSLNKDKTKTVYVIGGGEIYRQSIYLASGMHLTRIYDECPEADTFFPEVNLSEWYLLSHSDIMESEDGVKYRYETWIRK